MEEFIEGPMGTRSRTTEIKGESGNEYLKKAIRNAVKKIYWREVKAWRN